MKNLFALVIAVVGLNAFAHENDLVLPGAKWNAAFKNYVCVAFGPSMDRPSSMTQFNVIFENIVSDQTLDNGLIKATFEENGSTCRYNVIVFADNAAATMRLVNSKAFAVTGDSSCEMGKAMLDGHFASNNYLYYGHPHNLAIMAPVAGSRELCGSDMIGINFVVTGRIAQ